MSNFKVFKTSCKNCLLSKDRIVSPKRAKELIQDTIKEGTYFICHKASMNDEEICCKGFYDKFGDKSQQIQVMKRLDNLTEGRFIEMVEQPDCERLPSFNEMNNTIQ